MTAALQQFSHWFWSDKFWLPGNYTWEDYEKGHGTDIQKAYPRDLIILLPMAVLLLMIRQLFEK